MTFYPTLLPGSRDLIAYHYQNYPVSQSALPFTTLAAEAFVNGVALKPEQESPMWKDIAEKDSQEKQHWYLKRRIGVFLFNIKDAHRLAKRINLSAHAEKVRDQEKTTMAREIANVFVHFMAEWKRLIGEESMTKLMAKFSRGALDDELKEKIWAKKPDLLATHFRFLRSLGLSQAGDPGLSRDSHEQLKHSDEAAVLLHAKGRVEKEIASWTNYNHSAVSFDRIRTGKLQEQRDLDRVAQRDAVEKYQEVTFPTRELAVGSHSRTFAESGKQVWCDHHNLDKAGGFNIFYMNLCVLGYDGTKGGEDGLRLHAGDLANDPARSCMILAMPSVGPWGREYDETALIDSERAIEKELQDPELALVYRRFTLVFAPPPKQSKRPGVHTYFMCLSDQTTLGDDGTTRVLRSEFRDSMLWRRAVVPQEIGGVTTPVPMLAVRDMVSNTLGPIRGPSVAATNRGARRKQWCSGPQVVGAIHDALWEGMPIDIAAQHACWHDVFGFDASIAEAIMLKTTSPTAGKQPKQMAIMTVWADMDSRDNGHTAQFMELQKAKIAKWMRGQIRRKCQDLATNGSLTVPSWVPLKTGLEAGERPTYDPATYVATFPESQTCLKLRQTFLDNTSESLKNCTSEWDSFVKEFNQKWNPTGVAFVTDKKRSADDLANNGANKKPKTIEPNPDGPRDVAGLKKDGACLVIQTQGQEVIFTEKDASVWCWGLADGILSEGEPLALVFGTFLFDADLTKAMGQPNLRLADISMASQDSIASFSTGSTNFTAAPVAIKDFLSHLEQTGVDLVATELACHTITPHTEKDAAGDTQGRVYPRLIYS